MERKCILSLRIARQLIAKGFAVVDLERSTKIPGKITFIFERTPALETALSEIQLQKGAR